MILLPLDFETYYDKDYTLTKMTTFDFVDDPRFGVLAVSIKLPDGSVKWVEESVFREWAARADWSRYAILGHHTNYEALILSKHYGVKRAGYWFDTQSMDKALRPWAEHDLDSVGQHWVGMGKADEIQWTKGKRREDFTPEEWERFRIYGIGDVNVTYASFIEMLRANGGFPRGELDLIDLTIRMYAEPKLCIDESILEPYAREEKQRRAEFLAKLGLGTPEEAKKILGSSDRLAELLRSMGVEPATKKTDSKKGWTYAFAKDDPFMQGLLEDEDERIRELAQARLDTKSVLNVTRPDRFLRAGRGGRKVPVYLGAFNAHTHRWGGGDSMNWQNLERIQKDKPRSGAIRRAICAPPGEVIVVADSGQIEARKTGWLARQDDLMEAFKMGRDVYSEQASTYYGRKVDRKLILPDGSMPDEIPGFVGKVTTLGLGYGMGYLRLAFELLKGALGGPPVCFTEADAEMMGVDVHRFAQSPYHIKQVQKIPTRREFRQVLVHAAVCHFLVSTYRTKNDKIKELWEYAESVLEAMYLGQQVEVFRGTCMTEKDALLGPTGLRMHYHRLERTPAYTTYDETTGERISIRAGWKYLTREGWTRIWGSMLIENVVQWLCRHIVAYQMLDYYHSGRRVASMSHDEIIGVSALEAAAVDLSFLLNIMKKPPAWCADLPLKAEGGYATHYGDAKP